MRVLITGVAGFVGRHLVDHLLACGEDEIWGLTRSSTRSDGLDGRVRVVEADLCDRHAVNRVLDTARPAAIYHLASQASVAKSLNDPLPTIVNNVIGVVNLLEAAAEIVPKSRILIVGSNEEYGLTRPEELPLKETRELRPISPYAVSKVTQDMLGHQYFATKNLDVVRVRPFTHTGPRQGSLFVTPSFARQLAEMEAGLREPVMRVGFLDGQRDFTDVRDVARGYRLLIERGTAGEVYNLGSGVPRSIREILDALISMSSAKPEVAVDQELIRPLEVPVQYADCAKLHAATGWSPETPFEQTLADILADWRARIAAGEASR